MTPPQLLLSLAVVVTGLVTAAVVRPLLAWLPEPAPEEVPAGESKISYASLATPAFVLGCALASAVAAAIAWTTLPPAAQPLWTVLSVAGVLLAAIDARTTWMPWYLIQTSWAAMTVATLIGASLAGSWPMVLRAAVGAAVAGLTYFLAHRVAPKGFAAGDASFAPLLGAAAAAESWQLLAWALLAGTLVGAVLATGRQIAGRPAGFAYTPGMLGGAYLAALLQAVLR